MPFRHPPRRLFRALVVLSLRVQGDGDHSRAFAPRETQPASSGGVSTRDRTMTRATTRRATCLLILGVEVRAQKRTFVDDPISESEYRFSTTSSLALAFRRRDDVSSLRSNPSFATRLFARRASRGADNRPPRRFSWRHLSPPPFVSSSPSRLASPGRSPFVSYPSPPAASPSSRSSR